VPSRRSLTALVGLVVVLLLGAVLLATASTDSTLGRTRAHLGDAAESVGDALTVPSPTPTPTVAPVTLGDVDSGIAATRVRELLDLAQAHLAQRTDAGNRAALRDYDDVRRTLTQVNASDPVLQNALYRDAAALQSRLVRIYPTPSAAPSAGAS
jgi:hypothetical protein